MVCPTGAIKIEDIEDKRKIDMWSMELERAKCERCGRYFFTNAMIDYVKTRSKKIEKLQEFLNLCPDCRREILKDKLKVTKETTTLHRT